MAVMGGKKRKSAMSWRKTDNISHPTRGNDVLVVAIVRDIVDFTAA